MDSRLYLLNDDVHTFDDVIFTLRKHFGYSILHGASIATIVHEKGECEVKSGFFEDLEIYKESLTKDGFNVKIKKYEW